MAQYRIPVEETFSWQRPVISVLNDEPATPSKGDRYIVGTPTAEDPFDGHAGSIATCSVGGAEPVWLFDAPAEGWMAYNKGTDSIYLYDGAAWGELSSGSGSGDMAKSVYDTDNDGIVDKAETLDDGVNVVTATEAKQAYDRRGSFDSDLGCILMTIE